ncbi:MAG: sulfate adenylyltransferase, partial [Cytophagia bacterium]|nr:sulfate adenylyltransferase [Cytophagia bacterium]
MVKDIHYILDINTLNKETGFDRISLNDIIKVSLRTTKPIMSDSYRKNRSTGAIILVDESTNETVAAGMVV